MTSSGKGVDPAFQGAGQKVGTEIWRIENFQPVPLPKSEHGKFYSGDSYIILQTTAGRGGAYLYDIHFWLGKDTTQDEAGTAAIKTVELDAALGGRAVQHREMQSFESEKFLSYFKPCIIPFEGGVASGFKEHEDQKFEAKLYVCKGKRVVRLKQVPFSRNSLNHDDVFILDTENKIYQFNGANSNIQERAKALEAIQHLKDVNHEGHCDVAVIEDGKLVAEGDSGEFWVLFGGFAPIGKKVVTEDDHIPETTQGRLYSVSDSQVKVVEGTLSKSILENNQSYLLDCGSVVYVWVGRVTLMEERKAAYSSAEEFISSQNRPKSTRLIRIIQGFEPQPFRTNFESWPMGATTANAEDGRGKVAALLKQRGDEVKGSPKGTSGASVNEDIPTLLEPGGKIEVWRINGNAKSVVPKEEIGKFYSGDCYIILYTYHSMERKEDYFLSCWVGKDSVPEDHATASRLATTMANSLKGRPVQGRIFQGREPPQLVALFQPMVVLKGGLSFGFKKLIVDKGVTDETYSADSTALFRISGASIHSNKALQVAAVATSLSSTDCFVLQAGSLVFIWHGGQSTAEQQQQALKVAEFLKAGVTPKHAKEGTEPSAFWPPIGGKQSYTSKKTTQEIVRDPHLYTFTFNKGKMQVTEVNNFSQDDLLTEDIMILDTHAEVFVWVGQSVNLQEKQKALEIGQSYVDLAANYEGLPVDVPLYKVTEGNEPSFFTSYFSWDNSKASAAGNSFQKKIKFLLAVHSMQKHESSSKTYSNQGGPTQRASALAALSSAFNPSSGTDSSVKKQENSNGDGHTQRRAALAALSSAFNPSTGTRNSAPKPATHSSGQGSQRAAAVAALSSVLTAEQRIPPEPVPPRIKTSSSSETFDAEENPTPEEVVPPIATSSITPEVAPSRVEDNKEGNSENPNVDTDDIASKRQDEEPVKPEPTSDENGGSTTFSYDRLISKSTNPITGIDYKRRESYLSDAEFQTVFGISKEAFSKQPRWKQDMQKRKLDLF